MMSASCIACVQDGDEGFVEDGTAQKQKSAGNAPPLGLPAHFALKGTAEHTIVSSPRTK